MAPEHAQQTGPAQDGRAGVEAEWEQTPDFHKAWLDKSRDVIARAEWRRRKLTKRVRVSHSRP